MIEVNKVLYELNSSMTVSQILKTIGMENKDIVVIVNEKFIVREDYDIFIVADKSVVKVLSVASEG